MNQEARLCQNCKQNFTVEPEDFEFYKKIDVPAPTWCPECRLQRRTAFYVNIFTKIYRRKCDATGKELITIFPPSAPFPVYENHYWHSDQWDPMYYGFSYDFSSNFFEQFKKLLRTVPRYHSYNINCENCDYCVGLRNSKNCYLATGLGNENCAYLSALNTKNSYDSWFLLYCDSCLECTNCERCYRVFFSKYANNCIESAFLYNCSNCDHCFGCVGLRNKSYHIWNQPVSKEEYEKKLEIFGFGSFSETEKLKKEFIHFLQTQPHRFAKTWNSTQVTGDNIRNSKNCKNCFGIFDSKDCKYGYLGGMGTSDTYDAFDFGPAVSLSYEISGCGKNNYKILASSWIHECKESAYSELCFDCSYIFGCIGLKKKQYCIFNKQYTKEEYEKLVPKIIQHMDDTPYVDQKKRVYRYGDFFPTELSSYAYNESVAQEYFPLTKDEIEAKGYRWQDSEAKEFKVTLSSAELPERVRDVPDSITKEVIRCAHEGTCKDPCTKAFRITLQEFDFYKRMGLPLPRLCSNCRHYERVRAQNPMQLWRRDCGCAGVYSRNGIYKNTITHSHGSEKCSNEFETSYSPERKEIVYCESCYNAEIV